MVIFFKLYKYESFNGIIYFDIQFKKHRQLPLITIKPYFDINPKPFLLRRNKWIYEIENNKILEEIKSLCKKTINSVSPKGYGIKLRT